MLNLKVRTIIDFRVSRSVCRTTNKTNTMKTQLSFLLFLGISLITWAQTPTLKQQNNLYALATPQGKALSDYYNAVYDFEAGIAIVRTGTKFGAIDKNGKVVIPVNFSADEIKQQYNQYIENFVKANPNNQEVLKYLAQIKEAEEQKRIAELEKQKKQKEAEEKQRISDLTKKASDLFKQKKYEDAIATYQEIIKLTPDDKYAYGNAGLAYRILKNYEKAEEYLAKSIEIDNEYIWAINQLSLVYSATKQYAKAYAEAKKLIRLEDDNYSHYFNLSFYALFVNKPEESIAAALKSLELDPKKTGVFTNLVLGYVLNNEFEKAKPIYLEWKGKNFPDDERLCETVFLQDIADLESAGIKHNDFEKVKALLK